MLLPIKVMKALLPMLMLFFYKIFKSFHIFYLFWKNQKSLSNWLKTIINKKKKRYFNFDFKII